MSNFIVHKDYFTVSVIGMNAGWQIEVKGPGICRLVPLWLGESDINRFQEIIKSTKLSDVPFETAFMVVAGAAKVSMRGSLN